MQKEPLLTKNSEEKLKTLFSEAAFHLQKIKENVNLIEKETEKALKSSNLQLFFKKKDEIVSNVTKEVLDLKTVIMKIEQTDVKSTYMSDLKSKNLAKLKETFDMEIDKYGNIMKKISEMKLNHKIKQSRISFKNLSNSNISESQFSNDEENLQNEERIKQMQIINFEEELVKERDEDIKEIVKLVKNLKEMVVDINEKVIEQGETLQQVEDNVDIAKENVQQAEKEIKTANIISKSNLKKKLQICGLVFIAVVILALILGLTLGLK